MREGWQNEARATLIKKLKERPKHLPIAWIEAVASFEDRSTYEDLTIYFINVYSKEATYNIIKNLPGFNISDAVARAWGQAKSPRDHEVTCKMIPIAMEFGHLNALELAVKIISGKAEMNRVDYIKKCYKAIQKYTDAKGSAADIEHWFYNNKEKLVFDRQRKKFIVAEEQ